MLTFPLYFYCTVSIMDEVSVYLFQKRNSANFYFKLKLIWSNENNTRNNLFYFYALNFLRCKVEKFNQISFTLNYWYQFNLKGVKRNIFLGKNILRSFVPWNMKIYMLLEIWERLDHLFIIFQGVSTYIRTNNIKIQNL